MFRDHHLSDFIGFVYSRMDSKAAAADLHERLRFLGERVQSSAATDDLYFSGWRKCVGILSGKWAGIFARVLSADCERSGFSRVDGVREAIAAAGDLPVTPGIFPASWINANFDVWIGQRRGCGGVGIVVGCAAKRTREAADGAKAWRRGCAD